MKAKIPSWFGEKRSGMELLFDLSRYSRSNNTFARKLPRKVQNYFPTCTSCVSRPNERSLTHSFLGALRGWAIKWKWDTSKKFILHFKREILPRQPTVCLQGRSDRARSSGLVRQPSQTVVQQDNHHKRLCNKYLPGDFFWCLFLRLRSSDVPQMVEKWMQRQFHVSYQDHKPNYERVFKDLHQLSQPAYRRFQPSEMQ